MAEAYMLQSFGQSRNNVQYCAPTRQHAHVGLRSNLKADAKDGGQAEEGLAATSSIMVLPRVGGQAEQDNPLTALLDDALGGLGLLRHSGDSETHGLASRRPATLQDDTGLTRANLINNVKLALNELTSLGGSRLGVEESVSVGANRVNNTAESGRDITLLPDVDSLGGRPLALVAAELALALGDQVGKLLRLAVAVEHSLVTDRDEVNKFPLGPRLDGADLLGDAGVVGVTARGVNEDTQDHLQTMLGTGATNVGEGIAVSGVDTDSLDTSGGNTSDVHLDLGSALATTLLVGLVRSVRDTPSLSSGSAESTSRLRLGGRG